MMDLAQMSCVSVEKGAVALTPEEIERYHRLLPEWDIVTVGDEQHLTRTFKFKNFAEALMFTNRVGQAAEQQNHHPSLLTEWGKVTVSWWTHTVRGLHLNDFIMAARTEQLK